MWFSNKNYPVFSAVEPNVNPLPACLDKTRPEKYMSQFLPGNYSESIKNPGYLTLPGEILFKINNYKTIALWNVNNYKTIAWLENYLQMERQLFAKVTSVPLMILMIPLSSEDAAWSSTWTQTPGLFIQLHQKEGK